MASSLVFTIIGSDRPGLIEQISTTVSQHEANWLGSRMAQLGGKFAGMIQVEGEEDQLTELQRSLEQLSDIRVLVELDALPEETTNNTVEVSILGLDRPGIVREVSEALAADSLNVLELQTNVQQAAMTGKPMFSGTAVVDCDVATDLSDLVARLDEISRRLGVDIDLEE